MLAIAGGIIIALLVLGAFGVGMSILADGLNSDSKGTMGCGCAIMLVVAAVVLFVIF
jgi:hypothetical protein